MVLVDIGNTNIHVWEDGKIYDLKKAVKFNDKDLYFISVNEEKKEKFLEKNPNAFDLEKVVKFDTSYEGLGIDRIMACKTIKDGVVVDAGSAITLDIMQEGMHLGGVIFPGISSLKEAYAKISPKLDTEFTEVDFKKLPHNTKEAVSYGGIGSLLLSIEFFRKNKKLYCCGGDGKFIAKKLNGIYLKDLVFRGMIKTIKEDL